MGTGQRKTLRTQLAIFGLILVTVGGLRAQENGRGPTISKENRTIAITATERVLDEADTATVHVGFLLYAPSKDAAYAAGSRASNAVVSALLGAGVAKNAIQSENQSLGEAQPYNQPNETPADKAQRAARAFTIQQSWTVQAAANDAAKLLDVAVKAGANQSGQIDWSLHDPNAAQSAAATKAMQRARTQATAMANGLGVHLGTLLYASNQVDAGVPRAAAAKMDRFSGGLTPLNDSPAPLAINAREIETAATVYAVFALE